MDKMESGKLDITTTQNSTEGNRFFRHAHQTHDSISEEEEYKIENKKLLTHLEEESHHGGDDYRKKDTAFDR